MNTFHSPIARTYSYALTSHAGELERRFQNILDFAPIPPKKREKILSDQILLEKIILKIRTASIPPSDQPLVYAHLLGMEDNMLHP